MRKLIPVLLIVIAMAFAGLEVDMDLGAMATEQIESVTMGQRNALSKANSYLSLTAFSRQGLIEQLEYEGFSHSDCVYAVNHCGADWNEQAALKAESYLELTSFSRSGLIDQLVYEGFTRAQAVYGVDAVGY